MKIGSRSRAVAFLFVVVGTLSLGGTRAFAEKPAAECVRASYEGQQLRDAGKYKDAHAAFDRCMAVTCPALIRQDCAGWIDQLNVLTPTVVFAALDASGADVAAARVRVDGAIVAERLDGRPRGLDPGSHVVRFEGENGEAAEQRIVVRAGEKDRIVTVKLTTASVATAGAPPGPKPEAPPSIAPPAPLAPRSGGSGWLVAGLVVGGASVAALGVGIFLGLAAERDLHALEREPCAQTRTCATSDVNSVNTRLVVSDVLVGVGVLGAAVSASMIILRPSRSSSGMQLHVGPAIGGGRASLSLAF